jgi:hypothetical protein
LVVAVGLAALICAVTPARGQQGQNPTQGPTTPRFFIGLPVNSENEKHKDAVAKAKEYLESLKGDAKAQEAKLAERRLPPEYPGEKGGDAAAPAGALEAAAASAVPPIGPAGALIGAAVMSRPGPPAPEGYRWVKLGLREQVILSLDPSAKNDTRNKQAKDIYAGAAKAREEGKIYIHSDFKWPIYSRPATGGEIDYFTMVYLPPGADRLTERDIGDLANRTIQDTATPRVEIVFVDADRLKAFTDAYKRGGTAKEGTGGLVFLVAGNDVLVITPLTDAMVSNRTLSVGSGRYTAVDRERIHDAILTARKRPSTP